MDAKEWAEKPKLKNVLKPVLKILLPLTLLYIIFRYQPLLLIIFFEIFDLTKLLILRKRFKEFPTDIVFVFGITAAYYYGFLISIIIFILGIINRLEVDHIKDRHVTKCIRHFTLFFLASLLTGYSFFTLSTFLLLLNYLVKYSISMMESDNTIFDKSLFHVFNFISSIVLFYFIDLIFEYFSHIF